MTVDLINTCKAIVSGSADKNLLHNNANKPSERIPVMKNMIAGEVAKFSAREMLPSTVVEGHDLGEIHFHDMDESPLLPFYNCCLVDLRGMLSKGFKIGNAEIETPKSIATACAVTAQIIAQVASHQYGGVSLNRLDEVLAPYVEKSYLKHLSIGNSWLPHDKAVVYATDMTHKEVDSACQGLEYEINTLFTSQGQTPFVTFGFGLGTSWQAKAIQRGILNTRIQGLGRQGRTAIFPKLVYMVDEGINQKPGDANYSIRQLAIECASKRNYPDVLSMPLLRKEGGGCAPMGCRSFLHEWQNEDGEQVWDGRNNLGVVSINLPRIALDAEGDSKKFWEILDERIALAKVALDARIDRLRDVKAKVAPILYCEGALGFRLDPEDNIFQVFENQRASISLGYIGMHELANAMFPHNNHILECEEKKDFTLTVLGKLKAATEEWKKTEDIGFGLYSTPSESLCDRFCRIDKGIYGLIQGVTDKEYYTNSFHLDVMEQVSPMSKIDFEAPYHPIANSGRISYVEVPNIPMRQSDLRETYIETVWNYAFDKVAYFGTNCAIDYCHDCGSGGDAKATDKGFACEFCGNTDPATLEVTKRVCGYLGNPDSRPFNDGKQEEVVRRVKHTSEDNV